MSIQLIVEPNVFPMTWEGFCKQKGPWGVAIDGFVADGPKFDDLGNNVNFNHHEAVDRLATRATCAQVLMAIRQGLLGTFRINSEPYMKVYCNDCDQDVCTSWMLLNNHYIAETVMNPILNRLVAMEDALDTTAGAYPYPKDLPALKELAWVLEPYTRFRVHGGIDRRNAEEFRGVIEDIEHRIKAHIIGHGKSIPLDLSYQTLGNYPGWSMVINEGMHGRTGMFADGIKAFVSVRERPNKRWSYVIGRMSIYLSHFDIPQIEKALNEEEGTTDDRWGGGNNIIGSPRVGGSQLTPTQVIRIINKILANNSTLKPLTADL